jgi:predicted Zn-dependent protease
LEEKSCSGDARGVNVRLKVIAITGCTLLSLVMAAELTYQSSERVYQLPEQKAERLFFQPLGDFPDAVALELKEYFENTFESTPGLRVTILPTRALPPHLADPGHAALAADALLGFIRSENLGIAGDPRSVVIGLTTVDVYAIREGYVWAWRGGRFAVVSTAMFGPLDGSPAGGLARTRLRKMVAKNVGILYYHKPTNNDSKSVLYYWLGSVTDIDRAAERF